ncbi:MAG: hypothetical protein BWK78_06065 [Thiotrichaceae bacterium IS1]|nr:MAG: hypothetical protein BWK78_06065 [Thiotrichaceae bacterium IS1]
MDTPFDNTLQSLFDSSFSAVPETPTFGQDSHNSSVFDAHSFAQTYQTDHFSQENQWNNTSFHSAPEHSLSQDIDSLLNGGDSSDDSNNLNATNFTMPTFQHHAHYHPPHEHFQMPSSYEGELQHVASSENCTFHSSMDVNVSGSINHNHRWVDPNNSYAGSSDAGSSYSNAPSSDTGRIV